MTHPMVRSAANQLMPYLNSDVTTPVLANVEARPDRQGNTGHSEKQAYIFDGSAPWNNVGVQPSKRWVARKHQISTNQHGYSICHPPADRRTFVRFFRSYRCD